MGYLTSRRRAAVAVVSLGLVAGCGGGGDKGSSNSAPTASAPGEQAPKPAVGTGVPSYTDVKKLALSDPAVKDACAKGQKDVKVGAPPPGEQDERFYCQYTEVFEYSVGPKLYAKNFAAARRQASQPVWQMGTEAYIDVASIVPSKGFAAKVKKLCGCGEVVRAG